MTDTSGGWIKLHRKTREHWIWQDPIKLKWWLDILLEVNHSEKTVLIGNQLFKCGRGESVRSLKSWADKWKTNKDTARNFLKLLQKDDMILLESLIKTTRLTVCNYEDYQTNQHDEQTKDKRKTNDRLTHSDPNKNLKNEKNLYTGDFMTFWSAYPKKVGKDAALKAWQKKTNKPLIEVILAKIKEQIEQPDWKKENGQYIPYPATYINQARWFDENKAVSNSPSFTM